MDAGDKLWHFADMSEPQIIPIWNLYGESQGLPDVLHIETIQARAEGLDWRIAPHRHKHLHQLSLIVQGAAQISLDGVTPRATAPFLLNIPPGVVHDFTFAAGTEGWVLTLPLQSLPDLLEPAFMHETALGRAGILPADGVILGLFQQISAEYRSLSLARAVMLRALAAQLACHVARELTPRDRPQPKIDPRLLRFQTLLQQHLRDRWTLADFARDIGLSERHLSRISKAETGQNAASLMDSALMREACRLLAYTAAPIAQIGYDLGFDDPPYFSRAFKRAMGLSPRQYRAGFDRG